MTLQNHRKWNSSKNNCKVGDTVLLNEKPERNRWPMVKITVQKLLGND